MRFRFALFLPAILVCAAASAAAQTGEPAFSHKDAFAHYEGTQTCLQCHQDAAEAFFHSQHYQWRAETPALVNAEGRKLGKLNTINDFCTNPQMSWIGVVKNSRGDVISEGCSKCHAGFGRLPTEEMSQEQLENIDCLICHASGYRRGLYESSASGWEWKPILWQNQEGLDSVSKRIGPPTRVTCLRCHAGAGGGPNFKRGDIEYALADCDSSFDVHMAKSGHDMQCVDCHRGEGHRVRGRGADLSGTDMPGASLSCAEVGCHGEAPHRNAIINKHARRVDCATCHVTVFAKADATDMARDWSRPVYREDADKYSATITMQQDVPPVYAWYNGHTSTQLLGEPVERMADGRVGIMLPQGDRSDPTARIAPFKFHTGRLPLLTDRQWLIPIAVEEFFADGKIDEAVRAAAKHVYGIDDAAFEWIDTVRYMGIYHEVQPKAQALKCADCHGPGGRLDWKALGYPGDPRAKG